MHGPDVESAVKVIAENVISAFERDDDGAGAFLAGGRGMAVAELMCELLDVMPTEPCSPRPATASSTGWRP